MNTSNKTVWWVVASWGTLLLPIVISHIWSNTNIDVLSQKINTMEGHKALNTSVSSAVATNNTFIISGRDMQGIRHKRTYHVNPFMCFRNFPDSWWDRGETCFVNNAILNSYSDKFYYTWQIIDRVMYVDYFEKDEK